jgi:hypothetical protein
MYKIYQYWKKFENVFYMNIPLNFEICISRLFEVSCRALESGCSLTAAFYPPSSIRIPSIRCKGNRWHSNLFLSLGSKEIDFRILRSQNSSFRFWIYCNNRTHVTFYIYSPQRKYEEIWEYLVLKIPVLVTLAQETKASLSSIHEENNKRNHE